jgi:hypothetical protein
MNKKSIRFTAVSLAAATFVASIATMSVAATQTNGSAGPLHIYRSGTLVDPASTMPWTQSLIASSSSTSISSPITCPVGATGYAVFLSPRGSEGTKSSWNAWNVGDFTSGQDVLTPNLRPSNLSLSGASSAAAVKAAGGNYSLGVACTSNNHATIGATFYRHIVVTAGSGDFTATATADVEPSSTPTGTATPNPVATSGTVALSATTIESVEGALSLAIAAPASTTFGTATLVDNKSTSTGALPNVTVVDERYNTMRGWDLKATVADFVKTGDATTTIAASNLGIAPSVVTGSTTAAGVTAGTARTAGTSFASPFTFASAAASQVVGTSVIGGTLTFVAPVGKPAGTYTSTLTLTLTSK